MRLKTLLTLAIAATAIANANAQTYKPDFATKVVLAGNGTDITNTVTITSPTQGGPISLILPAGNAAGNGYVLSSTTGGTLSWVNPASASNAWNLTGNASGASNFIGTTDATNPFVIKTNSATRLSIGGTGTINVAGFGTAGVVHNLAGGDLSSSLIVNADITNATIDLTAKVTGILPIVNGGTGISTAAAPGAVVFGATATTLGYTAVGTTGMTLHSAAAGTPTWAKIALGSTAEVSGILLPSNGGTGVANADVNTITVGGPLVTDSSFTTVGNFPLTLTTTGSTNVTLPTSGTLLAAGGAGSFSTLTSTGNTTLGTSTSATNNSFGTGGNAINVINTIGSTGAGSMTTINGGVTLGALGTGVLHTVAGLVSTSPVVTGDITDANVTYAKIQNVGASSLFGNSTTSGAAGQDITLDASLKFSATTPGSTLAINLANANTWTATQTFPATSAQGDALITSLNASTQVLGVTHGGTGISTAPTPGAVVFGATATTMGYTAAGTAGQVLQSNGAGTPTWVNAGATTTYASSTTNSLSTTTNDFAISSMQTVYYLQNTSGSSKDLTGVVAGAAGRLIILINNGTDPIVLKDKNAGSVKTNQFHLQGASDIILGVDGTVTLVYDSAASNSVDATGAWRVVANY